MENATLLAKTIQPATPNVRSFVIVIVGYHFGRQIIPTLLVIVPGTDIRELRSIVKIEAYGRFSYLHDLLQRPTDIGRQVI